MPDVVFWPLFVTFAAIAIGTVLKMVEAQHGKKLSDDECSRLKAQLDVLNNPKDEMRRKSEKITAIDPAPQNGALVVPVKAVEPTKGMLAAGAPQYGALVVPVKGKDTSLNNDDEKNKDISNLTVEEIITAINSAPPYQKDEISKKYIGIRVDWIGYFQDVMEDPRDKEKVMAKFNVSSQAIIDYSFWLSEKPENFPEIRVLKRESPIRVVGDIASASSAGLCVTLNPISIGVVKNKNT